MAGRIQAVAVACDNADEDKAIGEAKAGMIGRYGLRIGGRIDVHSSSFADLDRLAAHLIAWHDMSDRDIDNLFPETAGPIERLIVAAVLPPGPGHPAFDTPRPSEP